MYYLLGIAILRSFFCDSTILVPGFGNGSNLIYKSILPTVIEYELCTKLTMYKALSHSLEDTEMKKTRSLYSWSLQYTYTNTKPGIKLTKDTNKMLEEHREEKVRIGEI